MKVLAHTDPVLVASEKETRLVQLFANDLQTQEIADLVKRNVRTIENTVGKIKKKYRVKTIYGLVAVFYRNKLIQ